MQPDPVPNGRPSIQGLVRDDLIAREAHGVAVYGTPLQAFNGRDALRDAYEEALDLACYLRQAIEERSAPSVAPGPREADPCEHCTCHTATECRERTCDKTTCPG